MLTARPDITVCRGLVIWIAVAFIAQLDSAAAKTGDAGLIGDCHPGRLLDPGESCTYPDTQERFSVLVGGLARFLFGTFGGSLDIHGRIDGQDYDFAASRQDGDRWRIDRVAGLSDAQGNRYDQSLTDSFTDSTGRTILFRLHYRKDWDLGEPRGLLIFFHGNDSGTEQDMLEVFAAESFGTDRGLIYAVVASPGTAAHSQAGDLFIEGTADGGEISPTRAWDYTKDSRLIHELLQSDFGGTAVIDRDRIVFRGASQGTCFLNQFLARYAHVYGGGFHAWCGCIWGAGGGIQPPRISNPWTPTVPWSQHTSSQVAQRLRVFVEATTDDFLHKAGVMTRDYYRDDLGLETRWDLDSPGGHCAASETPRDSILEWLSGLTPVPRLLGSIAGDYDADGLSDAQDPDDDNDGALDIIDALPLEPREWLDTDADGIGDFLDRDADGDGIDNALDRFALDPREWSDSDEDGIGDNLDPDDDNDGVPDANDTDPLRGARNDQLSLSVVHPHGLRSDFRPKIAAAHAARPASIVYPEASGDIQTYHHIGLGDSADPVFEIMIDSHKTEKPCEEVLLAVFCEHDIESPRHIFFYYEQWLHEVYIDRNQNRDLTDDGAPLVFARTDGRTRDDKFWGTIPGVSVMLNVRYLTGETLPYILRLNTHFNAMGPGANDGVVYAPADIRLRYEGWSGWYGHIPVPGGDPVLVGTVDANWDGVFGLGTWGFVEYQALLRKARDAAEAGDGRTSEQIHDQITAKLDDFRDFACVDIDRDGWLADCGEPPFFEHSSFTPLYPGEPFMLDERSCQIQIATTGHRVRIEC